MRPLTGICNRMPTVGEAQKNRDYVILGKPESWALTSNPKSLTIEGKGTRPVEKEAYDFMSRGWQLECVTYGGTVTLEDGTQEPVEVTMECTF